MYTETKRSRLSPALSESDVDGNEGHSNQGQEIQNTSLEDDSASVNDEDQNEGNESMYEILTLEQVHGHMKACINSVGEILPFSAHHIRILLRQFGWDKESLKEAYFDSNDDRKFLEVYGIFKTLDINIDAKKNHGGDNLKTEEEPQNPMCDCEICYDSFPISDLYSLSCHHNFCHQCWRTYVTNQIMNEGLSDMITCPGHCCKIILEDQTILRFIEDDENVYSKYKYLLASSFVQCNPLMCWCLSPNCTNVITAQWKDIRAVTCNCGFQFCFTCKRHHAHDPIECHILEKWMRKQKEFAEEDDPASTDWINNNTKPCPKCKTPIEKDGGCNHVKCSKCFYEFCFLCLGPSHGHVWSCSRPEEIFSGSPTDTSRLKYFSTHFHNHSQSLTLERKLLKKSEVKMNELHENENISWVETQFLQNAIKSLCSCRQTVMYSYVFRYYTKDHSQLYIFDKNHEDLETATEKLSFLLGLVMGLTSEHMMKKRQQIFDQNLYCESRQNVLVSHASEGYMKWWEMRSECV